nr:MAG TPA: C2H2 type zinc-finger protein [Caudoviricetes sp.]
MERRNTTQTLCRFCRGAQNAFHKISNTEKYSGVEIAVNRQGMLRVRVFADDEETFTTQDVVNINFCPMCGRRFRRIGDGTA